VGTSEQGSEPSDKISSGIAGFDEITLQQKHAELAIAEARLRIEAASTEQALREADLQRILNARATATEFDRVETLGRASRRGGEGVVPVSTRQVSPGRR
jgi:hypothetical protein